MYQFIRTPSCLVRIRACMHCCRLFESVIALRPLLDGICVSASPHQRISFGIHARNACTCCGLGIS